MKGRWEKGYLVMRKSKGAKKDTYFDAAADVDTGKGSQTERIVL